MGSGAGEATKPSNSLIKATVAALTLGPVHWRGERGEAREEIGVRRSAIGRESVERYIVDRD
jgi:hypothetical protein